MASPPTLSRYFITFTLHPNRNPKPGERMDATPADTAITCEGLGRAVSAWNYDMIDLIMQTNWLYAPPGSMHAASIVEAQRMLNIAEGDRPMEADRQGEAYSFLYGVAAMLLPDFEHAFSTSPDAAAGNIDVNCNLTTVEGLVFHLRSSMQCVMAAALPVAALPMPRAPTLVRLAGLLNASHLNGRVGLAGEYDEERGRLAVTLRPDQQRVSVRPINATVTPNEVLKVFQRRYSDDRRVHAMGSVPVAIMRPATDVSADQACGCLIWWAAVPGSAPAPFAVLLWGPYDTSCGGALTGLMKMASTAAAVAFPRVAVLPVTEYPSLHSLMRSVTRIQRAWRQARYDPRHPMCARVQLANARDLGCSFE